MKMEETEGSETSAYKIQTPENYPEVNIQHTEHGESLKSRILEIYLTTSPKIYAVFRWYFIIWVISQNQASFCKTASFRPSTATDLIFSKLRLISGSLLLCPKSQKYCDSMKSGPVWTLKQFK